MKNILCVLLFSSVISKTGYTQSEFSKLIIGNWVSEDDKKYELVFTKTTKFDYSSGKLADSFSYLIRKDSLITTDIGNDKGVYFYSIENLTNKYLSLMYLERGNMLLFRRKSKNSNP